MSKVERNVETPDPLTAALQPPPNESPAERWAREQAEAQARRVNDQIDSELKAERLAMKRRKPPIKVLLLGQSESGKSTTVKNFQLSYARSSFLAERAAWRAVIHLNLVRSATTIMRVLAKELPGIDETVPIDEDDEDVDKASFNPPTASGPFTDFHYSLLQRLAPLSRVQRTLEKTLGAASGEEVDTGGSGGATAGNAARMKEFAVTSRSGWKSALSRVRGGRGSIDEPRQVRANLRSHTFPPASFHPRRVCGTQPRRSSLASRPSNVGREDEEPDQMDELPTVQEAADVIAACAEDMWALWQDSVVRAVLHHRGMWPDEGPGFFLNDVRRITQFDYEPSDDDVVRARLRTMGVQEHRFIFEKGSEAGRDNRHAWYPYFDDINAIIFLAPISCFDEQLAEDRRVNRLQDSIMLWKAVCSTKLLANVQLILFLNKCDLLQKKLTRGVRVVDYIPTYGDRVNDAPTAAKYFRQQFRDTLVKHSPQQRGFYSYLTSVVDTKATAIQVAAVREGIQRNHLKDADIL
ncbi:G-alpha-domain-containing protein [Epithele typhae]|uniref:G-alpha-domain-containing protein n=1 Tax=Epithele typhae TaxID=378194 RepID=UPI00200781D9|nr:G-alpha-domain-containing protein [Epithele typhae]KAH9940535.1 G-alpha-domain-containing protein [Epithele typhae]